jgi:hypothetical protein
VTLSTVCPPALASSSHGFIQKFRALKCAGGLWVGWVVGRSRAGGFHRTIFFYPSSFSRRKSAQRREATGLKSHS